MAVVYLRKQSLQAFRPPTMDVPGAEIEEASVDVAGRFRLVELIGEGTFGEYDSLICS